MYDVLADDELLYSPRLVREGYVITEPQATVELNKAGSFTFNLPTKNPMYDKLKKLKTLLTIRDNGRIVWRGRVLTDDKDFYNTKAVTCEGTLAFLNDILYEPHDYSKKGITMGEYFKMLVNYYAENCTEERKLLLGNVTGSWQNLKIYPKASEYTSIWSLISTNLIGATVGKDRKTEVDLSEYDRYLCVRYENDGTAYLDYEEELHYSSGQVIEFGKNMLDLSEYIDASNVFTYIIPLGKMQNTGKRVSIGTGLTNGGKNYLKSDIGESLFGKIERAVIWEDETSRDELKKKGQAKLDKAIEMAVKITIRAFDLHLIDVDTDYIRLGDQVNVVSKPHAISTKFLCTKIVYALDQPENTEYSFGLNFESMTGNLSKWKETSDYQMRAALEQGEQNALDLADAVTNLEGAMNDGMNTLRSQVDAKVETWFYVGKPMLTNAPASTWTTVELKEQHLGDLYYDRETGFGYCWTKNGNEYQWADIQNKDIERALEAASAAQSSVDGKIRCFSNPVPPYEVGDLWVKGEHGDILVCTTARAETEKFNQNDWALASKYTDDSYAKAVNALLSETNKTMGTLQNQLDNKIDTWYGTVQPLANNEPAIEWGSTDLKELHLGDMYYDTSHQRAYYWDKMEVPMPDLSGSAGLITMKPVYLWMELQNADTINALETASHAQAAADGKIRFFSNPTPPYDTGDIWVQGSNGTIYVCTKARAEGENFNQNDWQLASGDSKVATDYIQTDSSGTHFRPTGQSNGVTVRPSGDGAGLQFDGLRVYKELCTNPSASSGVSENTRWFNEGQLRSFNAVLIGFKEYYTGMDSVNANSEDIQFHVIPLNGQKSICTRAWDITRVRFVTGTRDGLIFGKGGYYEQGAFGCKFVEHDTCCVPYIVFGLL